MAERQTFELFNAGHMVHVAKAKTITAVLERGLLSPIELGKLRSRELPEGTIWHPFENRLVKFRALERNSNGEKRRELLNHFSTFGRYDSDDIDTWPIGYIVPRNSEAIRMWEGESYFGIETRVSVKEIVGIVFALPPVLLRQKSYLEITRNRVLVEKVNSAVKEAMAQGLLDSPYPLVDHFGRHLQL